MNVDNLCMRATFKKNDDSNTTKRQEFFGPFSIGELATYLRNNGVVLIKAVFCTEGMDSVEQPMFTLEAPIARQQEDEEYLLCEVMDSMTELNKIRPIYYDLWFNHWNSEMPIKPSFLDFMDLIDDGDIVYLGDDVKKIIWKTLHDIGSERGKTLYESVGKKKFVKNYLNEDNGIYHTDIGYFKFT